MVNPSLARFRLLSTAVVLVVAAATLSMSCTRAHTDTIVLAESSLSVADALSFIATKQGYWKDQGLDVRVLSFTAGKPALDALLSRQAQFAFTGETPIAVAAFRFDDFVILTQISASRDMTVVARRSSGINDVRDLGGHKVAVFNGTQSDYFLYRTLLAVGVDPKSVHTISMQPPDMAAALANGDVDAISIWQPHSLRAAAKLGADANTLANNNGYVAIVSLVSSKEFIEANPDTVRRFLKGLLAAEEYAKSHQQEAAQIIGARVGIDSATLTQFLPDYDFSVQLRPQLKAELDSEAAWATSSGFAPTGRPTPHFDAYIMDGPLREVAPGRVQLSPSSH